ncbi:uncharacterized protein LOC124929088 [Impatiens glandulifera]|uniref:uncharacterized protein LOC124929088 n=1 Tax=Impatiens glandulifera TaxID=253017 RepID=UPI001FB19E47|nr:uncharacterized protein LOC124929088 [Impatiens glandulifera]
MTPLEALFGKKCMTPLHWYKVGERIVIGQEIVTNTVALIRKIRERLLTTHSRQKSYADKKRRDLKFDKGDHVLLKVSPCKGIIKFGEKVYNVFHVSNLRKYILNLTHIIQHEDVQWTPDLAYKEFLTQIIARQIKKLRNKEINMVKVLWNNHSVEEGSLGS